MQRAVLSILALVAFCTAAAILVSAEQSSHSGDLVRPATTYCNPLTIPDYPLGKRARDIVPGTPVGAIDLWLQDHMEQFRELADVTVLWHDGRWYMYPSVDMAWVSSDGGISWQHHPLNIRDIGYAPTIVRHKGRFLLMASESEVYISDSPLGPFKPIGRIALPPGLPSQTDPMLFSDDDGRLYYYWGCTPTDGIYVVELDADNPTRLLGKPVKLMGFEPERFPWQRTGDWNEDPNQGWIEGSWVLRGRLLFDRAAIRRILFQGIVNPVVVIVAHVVAAQSPEVLFVPARSRGPTSHGVCFPPIFPRCRFATAPGRSSALVPARSPSERYHVGVEFRSRSRITYRYGEARATLRGIAA